VTILLRKGGLTARLSRDPSDMAAAQALRGRCFKGSAAPDCDDLDTACLHLLIETDARDLVCCFRLMRMDAQGISASYSARFYELSALESFEGPMVEMGRFCVDPEYSANPDVLRLAWGAMTSFVDREGVKLLFGCASFRGTDEQRYLDSFAMLKERHLAPKRWLPRVKAPNVFRFAAKLRRTPDPKRALREMPPLLRTYLMMGGWVSDHAVVDAEMDTLHVFTGLEIAAIPAARKRLLRAVAG